MNSPLRMLRSKALPGLAICALAFIAASALAQPDKVLTLDIRPQKAGPALVKLAKSSGVHIMVKESAAANVEVGGLKGEYRFDQALAALLNDTGLNYKYASENVVLVQQEEPDEEPQRVEAVDQTAAPEEESPIELREQVVTGSRLPGGDPSVRVFSYTSEEIAARGVSTLEEFFRKLPWAFPSITTQTSNSPGLRGRDGSEILFPVNGLGLSTVNLRGLGSANTLVLMNGRRIAGAGGQEDDFVNLLNVPLSSIERVDIQLDGASAVYGSDAIGGVVNFITKKNYRGASATYRHEYSSTDANKTNAVINGGYAWDSGNINAVLTRSTSEPITNSKTGWDTLDFRPLFGPDFDRRLKTTGQPGVACVMERVIWHPAYPPAFGCSRFRPFYYQLSPDHSGVGATISDFHTFGYNQAPTPLDELPPQNGIDSTSTSLSLNMEQYLTDELRVFADVNWSINESYQEYDRRIQEGFIVPASNAYNPFGQHMFVEYAPIYENETGIMPAQFDESEDETRSIAVGFVWNLGRGHELEFVANHTKSWRETIELRARTNRTSLNPTAEAFYAALASPDPARAINVFGNGTAQGSGFEEFLTESEGPYRGVTETRQYNATLRGQLIDSWGGPITYSIGAEYRENTVFHEQENRVGSYRFEGINEEFQLSSGSEIFVGEARPTRDNQAYFAELAVPFFGPKNARPGLHSLFLTVQARYDINDAAGALGGGLNRALIPIRWHYWDPDVGFTFVETFWTQSDVVNPTIGAARNSDLVPSAGIQYKPLSNLTFRIRWSRSYRAPNWSDQFSPGDLGQPRPLVSSPFFPIFDPYDPDGPTELTRDLGIVLQNVPYTPDIQPEYSDSWTVGFDWSPEFLPGLRWTADWSVTDFTNRIQNSALWIYSNPEYIFDDPLVAVRNERGDLLSVNSRDINIAADYNELVTTQLEFAFDTPIGSFSPRIQYTRYLEDYSQVVAQAPEVSELGTHNGADEYTWQGSLTWQWRRFAMDMFVNYSPGYVHDQFLTCTYPQLLVPDTRCRMLGENITQSVSSLTTVDLTLTYRLDNGLRIRAGGTNLFDRAAPLTLSNAGAAWQPYDPTRWDARGQVLFVELNWEM